MIPNSRHCYLCNRCIDNYDHHCEWLNQCIGSSNALIFLLFIVALWLQMLFVIVICIDQVYLYAMGESELPGEDPLSILPKWFYVPEIGMALSAIIAVLCLVFIYPMTKLMVLHVRNRIEGITTF
jgi:palmitoyltransferase ZDHHC9/14/18